MPDLDAFQSQFLDLIDRPGAPLSPLTVYRNTNLSATCAALADNFPVVRELVGDELFGALALGFITQVPPLSPVLALYGETFADWLARQPVSEQISYVADVARCERASIEALFAANGETLTLADIAAITPEKLLKQRFTLHPATRFGWLATPAIDIWLAHRQPMEDEVVIDWRPVGYLFTRPDYDPQAEILDRAGHRLLSGLRLGETLGQAADATSRLYPATDIGALFARLVAAGAFLKLAERT